MSGALLPEALATLERYINADTDSAALLLAFAEVRDPAGAIQLVDILAEAFACDVRDPDALVAVQQGICVALLVGSELGRKDLL